MILDSFKKIHFIGICGVAMSALAIAFKKSGWIVTGSDAGFFPPISTYLKNHEIDFYPGWHPERMMKDGIPDLVVVGNVASSTNPEWMYVQEHKLNFKSYPEVVAEYIIKKNSIVCAGTYGKTTTSALLSWILTEAGYDPSYLFGGLISQILSSRAERSGVEGSGDSGVRGPDSSTPPHAGSVGMTNFESAYTADSNWSVVEGDEYKSARWDMRPKFVHYAPTHLLLTSVVWDHADVYPTEESYVEAFQGLMTSIPNNGLIVACADDPQVQKVVRWSGGQVVRYAQQNADYQYKNIHQTKHGIFFDLVHNNETYLVENPMLGHYQTANITGAFAMADQIGIAPQKIIAAVKTFPGLRRRLEKRFEGAATVFDDIAHSPAKAQATLGTLRSIYAGKIIAVFEPNTGNRQRSSMPSYDHAFDAADEVIIPELTKMKHNANTPEPPLHGMELAETIAKTHAKAHYIQNDDMLISHIAQNASAGDVVVFLGSHGFRGMIETLIQRLS